MNYKAVAALAFTSMFSISTLLSPAYAQEQEKALNFGIISTESQQNLKPQWEPFLKDMETKLGIKVNAFFAPDYAGIIQGMRPVIGYNFGAGERERVGTIYKTTLAMTGVIMAAGTLLCLTIANTLIGAFTDNVETIIAGGTALRIISAGFIVSTVSVTASGALEGIGMGVQSLVISLLRYIVVILPSAFILCHLFGGGAVWNAFWITEFSAAVVAEIVYRGTIKRTMPKPR